MQIVMCHQSPLSWRGNTKVHPFPKQGSTSDPIVHAGTLLLSLKQANSTSVSQNLSFLLVR
jgi:hypothetical protein